MTITVDPPIANRVETATSVVIKGTVILTAARARAPTPRPTKIPSTILYRKVSFGYPEGYLLPEDRLLKKQTREVSNIMAYVNDVKYANHIIPSGEFFFLSL